MRENFGMIEDLCAFADALFCNIDVRQVLNGGVCFDDISSKDVANLVFKKQDRYKGCSELECGNIADSVSRYICDRDALRMRRSRHGSIHVFELLADLVDNLLCYENHEVLCRYTHILYWRELAQSIGEELPVTAMYTIKDMEQGRPPRSQFTWNFVVKQNNEPLNQLMRRGISEHHMHLWASVPYFQVSWLNLMNNVVSSPYARNFDRIDNEEWGLEQSWRRGERGPWERELSLADMYRQAALIRAYLYARLQGLCLKFIPSLDNQEMGDQETDDSQEKNLLFVRELLRNPQQLQLETGCVQAVIASLQNLNDEPCIDYALYGHSLVSQEAYQVFSGERWFLYAMLRDIYQTFPALNREEHNLFYAYLLLQIQIRSRMVQVDNKVGFDHFQKIQHRKSYFLGDRYSTELVIRLAVREPLKKNPYLLEMEARIIPRDTTEQIYKDIAWMESTAFEDGWNEPKINDDKEKTALRARYYYVLHFAKEKDTPDFSHSGRYLFEYRHFRYRKKLEKKGRAICQFRERFPSLACRVRGIDACSQEIGCRPENFAFVFRALSNHVCSFDDCLEFHPLPKLRKTFHVGEDFLDLVDGLRAIDEAVHFLNLDCGDRLGHALALSIEPRSWYGKKNGQISLPKQDYLDNVAWLYHAIKQHPYPGMESVITYLKTQFEYYFRQIYLNNIDEQDAKEFANSGERRYREKTFARSYRAHRLLFSIDDYCRAWMLRGDHPELYESGYFWRHELLPDEWSRCKVNESYPTDPTTRYIPECSFLNFCYHYNEAIRRTGAEYITVPVSNEYIKGAEVAQKTLQFEIANRGLSIESNPTSNVKISTFRSYNKHPITRLYNKGLAHTKDELRQCPQISISVNTDDSGVFFTSLESEYAVLARALETLRDEEGRPLYYKWEIYDWLEEIRKMGNEQSFQTNGAIGPSCSQGC